MKIIYFILISYTLLISGNVIAADNLAPAVDKTNEVRQLIRGEKIYHRFCAYCHGKKLQGQSNWRVRKADGKLPAPPHDETGHTWHHPDKVLFGIIKYGLIPPYAPKNYKSDMPAWQSTLSDADIWAVLRFIKQQWPVENQEYQQQMNQKAK